MFVINNNDTLVRIACNFGIEGRPVGIRAFGNGHINDTYLVECDASEERYILQRINIAVFKDPDALMTNIVNVTEHIKRCKSDYCLRIIPMLDGSLYLRSNGSCWRMMNYVENSYSCEMSCDPRQINEIGRAYGAFISDLSSFPAEKLHNTIEHFHDTRWRFDRLMDSVREDAAGRRVSAGNEIRFAIEHEPDVDILNECAARGELPIRVTHNDTKINNILLDRETGRAICVIDLDTVMPGLAVTDFGDAIRSCAVTGRIVDTDPGDIKLDLDIYRIFLHGFEEGFPGMTDAERRMLPMGAKIMALECGIRYLTDYLDGDHYFRTDRPEHNLIRCRAQFQLVKDIEDKWEYLK